MSTRITEAEIEAGRSPAGGWTRAQLAEWGVPWPPPKGWRRRLTGRTASGRTPAGPAYVLVGKTMPENPIPEDDADWPPWEQGPVADDGEEKPPWE